MNTQHYGYERYIAAFKTLAQAEGRDVSDADLARIKQCIAVEDPSRLTEDAGQMNLRAGWIEDTIDRTKSWLEKNPEAEFEFRKRSWRSGELKPYDEQAHREFLAQCNNFSLKDGTQLDPAPRDFSPDDTDALRYSLWRKEAERLSPTRYEGEVRSSDVLPPDLAVLTHPSKWRGLEDALEAQKRGMPWAQKVEQEQEEKEKPATDRSRA